MVNTRCAGCRREAPSSTLTPALSVLDLETRALCPACIEHKAEALPALVRTVNEVGWRNLPEAIRDLIRVWDIDAYVTVPVWAERMSHRQLTVPPAPAASTLDREDELLLQRVRRKRQDLSSSRRQAGDRRTRKGNRPRSSTRWLSKTR